MIKRVYTAVRDRLLIARDPVAYARRQGVRVGEGARFLGLTRGTFGSEPYLVTLGRHVTVTDGVNFVTHDGGVWVLREEVPDIDVMGEIVVGDNCFIGLRAMILPGVTIGNNCVIAAGALVTRDIPDDSVAAGVPARVVSDLDSYRARSLEKALHIKHFPAKEKKRFLIEWARTNRSNDTPTG